MFDAFTKVVAQADARGQFIGTGERLELAHRSITRDHFARGAVRAAAWLAGREPGLVPIEEVLGLRSAG